MVDLSQLFSYILYKHRSAGTYMWLYVYTQIAHYSRTAVPSSVVTVILYSSEAGRVALRMTMTDALFSDTLYSTGSKSTIIAAEK